MNQPASNTIRIPIRGTYTYDRKTGELIDKKLEFADLPTIAVAEFLLSRFGLDPEDLRKPDPPKHEKKKPVISTGNTHDGEKLSDPCH